MLPKRSASMPSCTPGPAIVHCMAAIRNTNFYELSMVGPFRPGDFNAPIPHAATPITSMPSTRTVASRFRPDQAVGVESRLGVHRRAATAHTVID